MRGQNMLVIVILICLLMIALLKETLGISIVEQQMIPGAGDILS